MPLIPPIFLFDIDGVLVEPAGYRAAVHATLRHFLAPAGIPACLLPDDEILQDFEASGLTSEWDMVPVRLAR